MLFSEIVTGAAVALEGCPVGAAQAAGPEKESCRAHCKDRKRGEEGRPTVAPGAR